MKPRTWFVFLVLAVVSVTAIANVNKIGQILEQQREIREASEASTGAYARFDRAELKRMHGAQDRVFQLLDGVSDIGQLNDDRQVELFNALEEVKTVITENEDSRQVCWRERKLGTTLRHTRCATVAEIKEIREGGRDWHGSPSVCGNSGEGIDCGGEDRSKGIF
jgi:hypothetical protein